MAFMGEQWHDSSHKLLADAEQHHAHCFRQLLDAAAGLQADFMVAVITTVPKNLSDLSSIWCNSLQEGADQAIRSGMLDAGQGLSVD